MVKRHKYPSPTPSLPCLDSKPQAAAAAAIPESSGWPNAYGWDLLGAGAAAQIHPAAISSPPCAMTVAHLLHSVARRPPSCSLAPCAGRRAANTQRAAACASASSWPWGLAEFKRARGSREKERRGSTGWREEMNMSNEGIRICWTDKSKRLTSRAHFRTICR